MDVNEMVGINLNWNHAKDNYPQLIWLKYEAFGSNQTNIDDLIRMGIDNDCQVNDELKFV